MKPLPTTFRYDTYDFTLVRREGDIALFAKTKANMSRNLYEVVRVQKHQQWQIAGKAIEAREAMPSSEQWGTAGWSYSDPADAQAKFEALVTTDRNGLLCTQVRP